MMLVSYPVMAQENNANFEEGEAVTYATPTNQFAFPSQQTFYISKKMSSFKYNTGYLSDGFILLRFTNFIKDMKKCSNYK